MHSCYCSASSQLAQHKSHPQLKRSFPHQLTPSNQALPVMPRGPVSQVSLDSVKLTANINLLLAGDSPFSGGAGLSDSLSVSHSLGFPLSISKQFTISLSAGPHVLVWPWLVLPFQVAAFTLSLPEPSRAASTCRCDNATCPAPVHSCALPGLSTLPKNRCSLGDDRRLVCSFRWTDASISCDWSCLSQSSPLSVGL